MTSSFTYLETDNKSHTELVELAVELSINGLQRSPPKGFDGTLIKRIKVTTLEPMYRYRSVNGPSDLLRKMMIPFSHIFR